MKEYVEQARTNPSILYCLCNMNAWEGLSIELGTIGGRELIQTLRLSFVPCPGTCLLAEGALFNPWLNCQGLVDLNDITSGSNTDGFSA